MAAPAALPRTAVTPRSTRHIEVDVGRCAGCQECVVRCPTAALHLDPEAWVAVGEEALCIGCRQCERTCPFGAVRVEGPPAVAGRRLLPHVLPEPLLGSVAETRPGLATWEEAQAEAERCLACPDPTCVQGCPAHNDIPAFIAAVRDGDLPRAQRVLRRTSMMPDICSRVCDQASQCEGACSWALAGAEPVAIGLIERFIADRAPLAPPARPTLDAAGLGRSVAVVGTGPAGLSAAWSLVEAGAHVHLFEREREPLGVLAWGIPAFTLPPAVARRPLQALLAAGVELTTGADVGRDPTWSDLLTRFDAVLLAFGATRPMALRVPGADLPWVEDATAFLRRARKALASGGVLPDVGVGTRLVVVGAGNTAMDVARTARRLGAEALTVDWMAEAFARVRPDELAQARAEGVEVRFLTSVTAVREAAGKRWVELAATRHAKSSELPRVVGSARAVPADRVVLAMGYRVEEEVAGGLGLRLPLRPRSRAAGVLPRRLMASGLAAGAPALARAVEERDEYLELAARPLAERVWAAGDALTGPATVVAAMAQGRYAAEALLQARPRRPARTSGDG
jgi:glutamate synthase (NADPH/NADH) small chain